MLCGMLTQPQQHRQQQLPRRWGQQRSWLHSGNAIHCLSDAPTNSPRHSKTRNSSTARCVRHSDCMHCEMHAGTPRAC